MHFDMSSAICFSLDQSKILSFANGSTALFFFSGSDVVIVKNGKRICGTGAAFGNAPIVQNKAYFEIKLQSSGQSLIDRNTILRSHMF